MEALSVGGIHAGPISSSFIYSKPESHSPLKKSSTCQVFAPNSSSFLGYNPFPKGLLFSYFLKRKEGRFESRRPSALLNSHEYKKQKLEKTLQKDIESGVDSDNDEDLCPIECVREINTLNELEHVVQDSKTSGSLVVVDFFRTSCGSCRYIEKGFQKLCKGAGNGEASVVFLKHNVFDEYEEQSDIAEKFRIKVVPLFHFYKNGELVESFPTRDKARILETIYKHLGVDQTIEEWSDIHGLK
ncbi:thioredoxin-like 4, chloroplastic isoform X1 [Physcomitrium patens]|uniref:Thioredoxin domain-containing protein n=1 Tax=Physcomitrium patens TaxID=3218 RepID=A0A2K1JZL5_PHYPA|nr:thioredoxin-like 4, chloroplastic isoform X1 [Physcomitrium patens]PNR46960.1 hypothetical protein PHYPA_014080 [Physcomitrium patens]|eukprot:XP_024387568.1 thioredoxin-like 4, chloroplastic isoform X1 [Physcomitrella patens]